jgi:hypothetical protein
MHGIVQTLPALRQYQRVRDPLFRPEMAPLLEMSRTAHPARDWRREAA